MWFLCLCVGFIAGALALLLVELWWFLTPSRNSENLAAVPMQFGAQFLPFRIPYDLKQLLLSPGYEERLKKKESCVCFNLFVQFLYQEFRESKWFRRWIVKRLQMEFNDLSSRSAASKLLHDIKLRNFSVGTQFPVIKDIQVTKVTLAPDKDSFQDLDLTMDIDYRGGFEASVDVEALLGRRASLSVKVTRVAGQARLQMTRAPYSHWTFAFLHDPVMDFKVDSEFRGRPLPQLVPLIINQFRRTVRKKHVLPAYKVRYRPFFVNPFLQPAADPADYAHIEPKGVVRVTVIKCTRLNLAALVPANKLNSGELYCQLNTGSRHSNIGRRRNEESPAGAKSIASGSDAGNDNYVSIALRYLRHSSADDFGLTLGKDYIPEKVNKMTVVVGVAAGSPADRAGFKVGDLTIAVNNVGITTERQAAKLLSNTIGDVLVLVERKLINIENEDDVSERLSTTVVGNHDNVKLKVEFNSGDEFFHVSYKSDDANRELVNAAPPVLRRSYSDLDLAEATGNSGKLFRVSSDDLEASGESALSETGRELEPGILIDSTAKIDSTGAIVSGRNDTDGSSMAQSQRRSEDEKIRRNSEEQDDSSNSNSPVLSRKQRIAAKATEKAAQVAQKWSTGKAAVKDMWDRRQRKKHSEGDPANLGDVVVSVSMPSSKSEEAELKFKIGDAESVSSMFLSPNISGRPRSRSHSEPDTSSVLSAITAGDVGDGNGDGVKSSKSAINSVESESLVSVPSQQQLSGESRKTRPPVSFKAQTKPVPSVGEPVWYQNFPVPLGDKSRYLNVAVYWRDSKSASSDGNDALRTDFTDNLEATQSKKGASTGPKVAQDQEPSGPVALGYATIFLPEVLDDCSITKSLCHQQTYALRPPSVALKLTPSVEKLMIHPGFDGRLCYGDITLGFQWLPKQEYNEDFNEYALVEDQSQDASGSRANKQSAELDQGDNSKRTTAGKKATELPPEYVILNGHKWLLAHFQQSQLCHVCQKKIWLKSAYKCVQCSLISHKKCITRAAAVLGECGQIHETVAFEAMAKTITALGDDHDDGGGQPDQSEIQAEVAADAVECISPPVLDDEPIQKIDAPATSVGKRSTGLGLTERFAGLRRRKPKVDSAIAGVTAAHAAVPTSLESLNNVDWGSIDDNSPFHSLLYTKGGTYNEHMILAAKDLGKDLYTSLPLAERKSKINEQIDRLQTEIDQTTEQRLEMLKRQGNKPDKGQLAAELAKLDDKLQALALLMLHYCAGLQCCLDLEDSLDNESDVQLDSSSGVDAIAERAAGDGVSDKADLSSELNAVETENGTFISSFTTTLRNSSDQKDSGHLSTPGMDDMFVMDTSDDESDKVI